MESSSNSKMGSYHWFHTLVSRCKDIGEYLKDKTPKEEILREWGNALYDTSKELIEGYSTINETTHDVSQNRYSGEKDIEKLAELTYPDKGYYVPVQDQREGFIEGYKAASQNRYSKEDLLKAVDLGLSISTATNEPFTSAHFKLLKETFINGFIKSLSHVQK